MSVLYIKDRDGKLVPVRTIQGEPGIGIKSIERTTGNGSPGTTDIYTITFTDGTDTKFTVYNGADCADLDIDSTLKLENGVLSVNTTDQMEQDNTLPITSAGVFAVVGNIEALLKTI